MRIRITRELLALSCLGTVALFQLLSLPALIGVLVDRSPLTEQQAGFAASANFLGGAIIALALAFQMGYLRLRQLAVWALVITALADALSAFTVHNYPLFLLVRFVAGLGSGVVYVATLAAFSRSADPERGYGVFVTLQFIFSGLVLYVLPVYSAQLGVAGMFTIIATLDVFALLCCHYVPAEAAAEKQGKAYFGMQLDQNSLAKLFGLSAMAAMLGFGIYEAAMAAQFSYIERLAVSWGLSSQQIGSALLIQSLVGIPGAFTIIIIGRRFAYLGPLLVGIAVSIVGLLILIHGRGFTAFIAGGCLLGFSWAYCLPFIQSLLASLDRSGSVLAAASFFTTLGSSAGPWLAALLLGDSQYLRVLWLAIGLFVLAVLCFLVSDRSKKVTSSHQALT